LWATYRAALIRKAAGQALSGEQATQFQINALHKTAPEERNAMRSLTRREGERLRNTSYTTIYDNGAAVLQVNGPIYRRADTMESSGAMSTESVYHELKVARASQNVKSLLIDFDTPGGDAINGGVVAQFINDMAKEKRVEAFGSGYCASLGYLWASACSRLTLNTYGEMGSIGCVIGVPIPQGKTDFGDNILVDTDGTPWAEIVSSISPLKRADVTTKEGHKYYQDKVNHHADTFVNYVAKFRNLDEGRVPAQYGNGGCYPDTQALDMGLCDEVSSFEAVLERMIAGDWERGSSMTGSSGVTEDPPTPPAIPVPGDGGETDPEVAQSSDINGGDDVSLKEKIDAARLAMGGGGKKGQKPTAGAAPAEGAEGLSLEDALTQLNEQLPALVERYEGDALAFALEKVTVSQKVWPASQYQIGSIACALMAVDALFGVSVPYVDAKGHDAEGTLMEAFTSFVESIPRHSFAENAIKGIKDGSVQGKVVKPVADDVPGRNVDEDDPGDDSVTAEEAMKSSNAGQATVAARTAANNGKRA
jgi:ClpP class serine protease